MELKNDCERDYIKEAFDKLYNCVMPYIDLNEFANADMAFKELDKKVHSEIYILKKRLAESDRAVDAGLTRSQVLQERISDLEEMNSKLRIHNEGLSAACESHLKALSEATNELEQYKKNNILQRADMDGLEKQINDLKKKIQHLEIENANLRVTPDDAIRVKSLERANKILRRENGTLWTTLEKRDIGERTCYESLSKTIEFQNKKIEELEAEKARLKEECDVHEATFKKLKENVDLSYGHEFEFGDEVFVPWSDGPYMYVKRGMMYNPRTERLVYVSKDQHLKWFGEKFSII